MRSLRMKMVMIMVILILALMLTTGAFLMSGVGNFYVSQFYEQMEGTFTPEFIAQLQRLSAEDNAPAQMKELLMAQAGLGIDITGRNVYILDQTGSVLDSSNQRTTVVMTQNILSAMNGEVGQSSSVTNDYMDLAVPVDSDGAQYIAYIRDNRATVDALTSELLIIILRALALGLVICVILSFLLSQILITPIRALTVGTKRVAAGDFANRVTVDSRAHRDRRLRRNACCRIDGRDRRSDHHIQRHGVRAPLHARSRGERAQQAFHAVSAHDRRRRRVQYGGQRHPL